MDLDIPERLANNDDDSGSVFEASESPSHDDHVGRRNSRNSSVRKRSKSSSKVERREIQEKDEEERQGSSSPDSEVPVLEDANQWAAKFQPPDLEDIGSPRRHQRKRKSSFPKSANESRVNRAKRLKSYFNNDYRELLNADIGDIISGEIGSDQHSLPGSQIGSSIWSTVEKGTLFSALDRLGRDDVAGIAKRIATKSELEVQDYIQLLESGMKQRRNYRSHAEELLSTLDFPAAVEISPECCALLERAGDSIAVRQDLDEERVEKNKWGDLWLINSDVCRQIDQSRKEEGGEEEMEEILPAANLFNIKKWIELSQRVFMNAKPSQPEDSWYGLAESGETPAIRATAIEDFHSLAVSITQRLISTTLFCTMSRLRARGSNKVKHSEVSKEDVEAAVNILRLKKNSQQFWIKCARRCNLEVINDEEDADASDDDGHDQIMTYQEVEQALTSTDAASSRAQSRSKSETRPATATPTSVSRPSTAVSKAEQAPTQEDDTDSLSSFGLPSSPSLNPNFSQSARAQKLASEYLAFSEAQDAEMETLDQRASKEEEIKLWEVLKASPPSEINLEIEDGGEEKRVYSSRVEMEEPNWRERTEFWSAWEMMDTPISEEEFRQNKERKSMRAKRREMLVARGEESGASDDGEEDSDVPELVDEDDDIEAVENESESDEEGLEEGEEESEQEESDDASGAVQESDDELKAYLAGQADMAGGGFQAPRETLEDFSDDG